MNTHMQKKAKRSALKEWVLQADAASIHENPAVCEIADALMITRPTAQLLINRGCTTPEDARMFLAKAEEMFHDPFAMTDMREAAETILSAVEDEKKIAVNPAYELSFLKKSEQEMLLMTMDYEQATPSLSQAQRMKKLSQEGTLTEDTMLEILSEVKKGELDKVTFSSDTLRKYFPRSYTPQKMQDTIIKLLEQWQRKRQQQHQR